MGTPQDGTGTIRVGRRHNGPPDSGNGGYVSGLVARHARRMLESGEPGDSGEPREPGSSGSSGSSGSPGDDVVVQLLLPTPLDADLRLTRAGRRVHVWHEDVLIATASSRAPGADAPEPVGAELAERASREYAGRGAANRFPTCFVCGPAHPDGLRLAPGPVPGLADHVACLWTPDATTDDGTGTVAEELVWAALDCPGGWTLDPLRSPLLLGRMSARITALPRVGETVVAVGRGAPVPGRVQTCTTALFRRDGTELARSTATWVRLDPTAPLQDTKAENS
ncbi:hypothetical protein [Streptomyces sp. NPDC050504]|uniref:hypothetical protein n=1 Tax=Streptomyces sp. NPDC050504 TaxID=3365618 RepID=UPI0037A4C877